MKKKTNKNDWEEVRITSYDRFLKCMDIRETLIEYRNWLTDGRYCHWEYFIEPSTGDLVLRRK